ncbi:hypothetical protein NDI45_12865 [Leptolyngbya sp. GB1-A1]|uniref:hypothetical protein n=1 Tax=Leptolyngbya sp. GB1-A1 TaxID=2933908 RepID=UPI0032982B33
MRKLDDITRQRLERAYLAAPETTQKVIVQRLAAEFDISISTIRRYAASGNWDAIREGKGSVVKAAVEQATAARPTLSEVVLNGALLRFDDLLIASIDALAQDVTELPSKSRESAATALAKLLELYRRYHPMTIDEAIDVILAIPGFDPQAFAQKLRERYQPRTEQS